MENEQREWYVIGRNGKEVERELTEAEKVAGTIGLTAVTLAGPTFEELQELVPVLKDTSKAEGAELNNFCTGLYPELWWMGQYAGAFLTKEEVSILEKNEWMALPEDSYDAQCILEYRCK